MEPGPTLVAGVSRAGALQRGAGRLGTEPRAKRRRRFASRALGARILHGVVGAVLFVAVALVAAHDWTSVSRTVERVSPFSVAAAIALALVGLFTSAVTWRRVLRELGSTVGQAAASKIYLVGQLGKYIPGSLWAFLFQMELGRKAGVPRPRVFAAGLVAIGLNVITSLGLGLIVVTSVGAAATSTYAAVFVGLPVGIVLASPPLLTREVNLMMRILRRPPLERSVTWRGVAAAAGWSIVSWLAYGFAFAVLVADADHVSPDALLLCLGAVPLAMTAGFLVAAAPSGIGVREAALVAALASVLPTSTALALALLLRAIFTVAELGAAGLALVVPLRLRSREAAAP